DRADRDRPEPERREAERREYVEHAEEECGEEDEPERRRDGRVDERRAELGERLRLGRPLRRHRRRPGDEAEREDADRGEGDADPCDPCDRPEHRPEERAGHRRRERAPDRRAAPLDGRRREEPGERAGPRERARAALQETGGIEQPGAVAETEGDGADGHDREADEDRSLRARTRGDDPAGHRADERAGRVRAGEHARAGLAEAELVRVVRQERRQRGEEERVEEDDGSRKKGEAAHDLRRYPLALAMRVWVAAALFALVLPATASAGTVFLLDGRGWGHGVGMSQWGAEGYARHGFGYRQILAHYYPTTHIALAPPRDVRVLLEQGRDAVRVGSAAPFLVVDAVGRKVHLPARSVVVDRR